MLMKSKFYLHQHSGCCNSGQSHCGGCCGKTSIPEISAESEALLQQLAQTPFLPLGCFVLRSSRSEHLESVAFAPVYLTEKHEDMDAVRKSAKILEQLEECGIITLDYDLPLENYDYGVFKESAAFNTFKNTVEEGKRNPDFLFDKASIEFGSIALTVLGQTALNVLL